MFKPRKEEPANTPQTGKISMPVESGMPKSSVIKAQMDEANKRRGTTVEQAWTTSKPDQKFLLMCKWEGGAPNPVWTLYEETPEESKMHFSQVFDSSDFTMMYDVICMTVPSDSSSAAIPDALKPTDKPGRGGGGSADGPRPSAGGPAPAPAPAPYPAPTPFNAGPGGFGAAPQPGYGQAPAPSPYPSYQQNYPPPPPPQPMPYQQPAPQAPYNPAPPSQGSPWNQGYAPSAPAQNAPYAPSPSSTGTFAAQIDPSIEKSSMSTYSDLMTKQANVLLGTLLFESELINQNTLDAALKVQELVRENQMSPAQASDVLKRHHMMGASIAEYLTPEDYDLGKKASPKASASSGAKPGANSEKAQLQQSAFDILLKAGLLKEEDIKTATAVRNKHGGDMPSILQAAGKMDAKTYSAAEICIPLIKKGAMKVEQCIIALNYCSRSRVDFDSALDELGWENPRKAAK